MFKRISQFILTLAVLLVTLGNTVRIGICPCHGNFFIGDCECNLQSLHSHECQECPSPGYQEIHDNRGANNATFYLADSISDPCENIILEIDDPVLLSSSVKSPEQPCVPLLSIPAWECDFDYFSSTVFFLSQQTEYRPPPDLSLDNRLFYIGFMRPELA